MLPEQSASIPDAMESALDPSAGLQIALIEEPATKKLIAGQDFNKRPPCGSCGKSWKWSKMESWKVWDIYEDDEAPTYTWNYRCKDCIREQEGCETDEAAWAILYERNGLSNWKMQQAEKFSHTSKNIQQTFSVFGVQKTGREVYKMTRAFMIDLFSGLSEFIVSKSRQMATIAMECANAKDMIEELKNATDPARIKVLLELIEQTTADDRIENLTFEGSQAHNLAASFTDEWVRTPNGHFRHYYICLAGKGSPQGPCLHMIVSKAWGLLFNSEAWHAGQRYYCEENEWNQKHRYFAKYGVIVEIRRGDKIYYCRGDVPDQTKHDILALKYQAKLGKDITPAELYARIPIVKRPRRS